MSLMFCEKCDGLFDTDFETDCPHCESTDVEVAPGLFMSEEDFEAERQGDELRDGNLE